MKMVPCLLVFWFTVALGQVTLQFSTWETGALADYWPRKIAEFEAENPDIRIDLLLNPDQYESTILRLIAANSAPDVMQLFEVTVPVLAQQGNIIDLQPLIAEQAFDLDDFITSTLTLAHHGEGLYGLGSDVNPQILYYNADLFEAAGVALPDETWTWQDLLDAARALTADTNEDGRIDQWGAAWFWQPSGAWWVPALIQIWNNGGALYSDDLSETLLDSEAAIEAIEWWANLIHEERVSPNAVELGAANPNALFQQGRLAIYLDGTWNISSFEELPFTWDVAPIPANEAVEPTTFLHTSYYAISSTTQHPEAAWRWLSFITAPEAQTERSNLMRYLPTRESVNVTAPFLREDAPPASASLISDVLAKARMAPVAANNSRIIQIFERELTLVYLGEKQADQAMRDAAQEINRLLTP